MSPEKPFVDDYLLYLLARASHSASRQFHARVRARGLQVADWRLLASLWDGDGRTVGALAELTLLEQPTLTKMINRLERDGLVQRHADPDDGRKVRVRISTKGRTLCEGLIADARSHEQEILRGYGDAERQALKEALRTLIERCR